MSIESDPYIDLERRYGEARDRIAELEAERDRLTSELTMLREFAGDEVLMSDYQTAGDMRREVERLRAVLDRVDHTLRIPAAEYVPAIADVFSIIDTARAAGGER